MANSVSCCCFCGKEIVSPIDTNNPYPACTEEEAVRCQECNEQIVLPARMQQASKEKGWCVYLARKFWKYERDDKGRFKKVLPTCVHVPHEQLLEALESGIGEDELVVKYGAVPC